MGVVCKGIVTGAVRVECEDLRPRRLRVQPGEPAFRAAVDGYAMADEEVRPRLVLAQRTRPAGLSGPSGAGRHPGRCGCLRFRVVFRPRRRRSSRPSIPSPANGAIPSLVHSTPRREQRQETGMTAASNSGLRRGDGVQPANRRLKQIVAIRVRAPEGAGRSCTRETGTRCGSGERRPALRCR